MARTLDLTKLNQEAAELRSYLQVAAEAAAYMKSIAEAAQRATQDLYRIADFQTAAAQLLDVSSFARLQAPAILADLQGMRSLASSYQAMYQPMREALRVIQETNEANWRALVDSLRIP